MPTASGPGLYKGLEDKESVFYLDIGRRTAGDLDITVEGKRERERERGGGSSSKKRLRIFNEIKMY